MVKIHIKEKKLTNTVGNTKLTLLSFICFTVRSHQAPKIKQNI